MLSVRLKEATQVAHLDLERSLITRIKSIRTTEDYVELLARFYAYYFRLETLIADVYDPGILPDYPSRRKASSILNDLSIFDVSTDYTTYPLQVPEMTTHFSALGAIYVLEGSTLGGKIIKDLIWKQLGISSNRGFAFFNGYGSDTVTMWQTFKLAIDRQSFTKGESLEITAAANSTFTTLKKWMQHEHKN